MTFANERHVRNGVRGVGRLFKWLVTRRPMERKPMEALVSQDGGGFCKEQIGRAKWVQGLEGFK